eukprot:CAMPEP_0201521196 /NCGR_PEP_ID=MMETSP0161_2-20130828/14276_1 /ASSEMBLY_ACC=CAM_ASM_000251 /TAXON_ID=180227 /ORGANISM="Neoparamoeba aestuarina, Strain SoJaBio B1-5/56/2" /LENGTH=54 /DNA_ID=CAMNT_0047919785 /DNA_START=186 /DNA_END=347 /DNA_ORIENTATION=+
MNNDANAQTKGDVSAELSLGAIVEGYKDKDQVVPLVGDLSNPNSMDFLDVYKIW